MKFIVVASSLASLAMYYADAASDQGIQGEQCSVDSSRIINCLGTSCEIIKDCPADTKCYRFRGKHTCVKKKDMRCFPKKNEIFVCKDTFCSPIEWCLNGDLCTEENGTAFCKKP